MVCQNKKFVLISFLILSLANILAWLTVFDLSQNKFLAVSFFDIGQGDSILTEWMQYITSYLGLSSLI